MHGARASEKSMMSGHDWLKPQLRLRAMIGKSQQSQVFQLDMVYGACACEVKVLSSLRSWSFEAVILPGVATTLSLFASGLGQSAGKVTFLPRCFMRGTRIDKTTLSL